MERCPAMNLARRVSRQISVVLLAAVLGCSNSDSTDQSAETEANLKPSVASGTPDQAVHEFMMAFKNGDDAKASELLTEKTRQEVERTQYDVSPPGTKDLLFQVGEVQYVSEAKDLAHVACHITDKDSDGEESKSDMVWFLRKEQRGWRIAGVAMKVFPDQPPVLYNFEDMDDMERKLHLVNEEMIRRATQTITEGQQPSQGSAERNAGEPAAGVAEVQNPADAIRK
jgi:ketosteroid isomerase-like protein